MTFKQLQLSIALSLVLVIPAISQAQRSNIAAETITQNLLKSHLEFIASDELEGRETPSRGLDTAARYLAANLSRLGFKPMGDNGTFYQSFTLSRVRTVARLSSATLDGNSLTYGTDYYLNHAAGKAEGEMVFVGYGYRVPSIKLDPYKGMDVKGKVLVALPLEALAQLGITRESAQHGGRDGMESLEQIAVKEKASGVVMLTLKESEKNWSREAEASLGETNWTAPTASDDDNPVQAPTITLSVRNSKVLLADEQKSLEQLSKLASQRGVALPTFALNASKRLSYANNAAVEHASTRNVVGLWEGSDPALKSEFVASSAHYDHLGIAESKPDDAPDKDRIYNGADDDGSGTVAVLSMAEALAKSPTRPKRSVLLIWHCGEEEGLWGSEYFVEHPLVPLARITALLNIDMIGRSKPKGDDKRSNRNLTGADEIYVIGSNRITPNLGALGERVNKSAYNLKLNYKYDAPNDPENLYSRSDHFNYAKNGVPIIFYFDGVHEDYHRVSDEVSKIDFAKMEKVTRTAYQTLWELAENGLKR